MWISFGVLRFSFVFKEKLQLGTWILVDSFWPLITKSFFGWHFVRHSWAHHRRASSCHTLFCGRCCCRTPWKIDAPVRGCQQYWSMHGFLLLFLTPRRPTQSGPSVSHLPSQLQSPSQSPFAVRRAFYGGVLNLDIRNAGQRRTGKVPRHSHWHTWMATRQTAIHQPPSTIRTPHGHQITQQGKYYFNRVILLPKPKKELPG